MFTDLKLGRILQAANRLQQSRRIKAPDRQIALDDRTLYEEVTPDKTLVAVQNSGGDWRPLIWCPDESWAREYLENFPNPELLEVWEISREEAAPHLITTDFCERWLALTADYSEDEEEFLRKLPAFVQHHYGDEALEAYRRPRDGA